MALDRNFNARFPVATRTCRYQSQTCYRRRRWEMGAVQEAPDQEITAEGTKPWQGLRGAKIERARLLIQDRNYPPNTVVESVAALLAGNWNRFRHRSTTIS